MLYERAAWRSRSQSDRERAHVGYGCVEGSKAEGIKQRAGRSQRARHGGPIANCFHRTLHM
eukprot:357862-Chlamydomonas_euryale.AAC.1